MSVWLLVKMLCWSLLLYSNDITPPHFDFWTWSLCLTHTTKLQPFNLLSQFSTEQSAVVASCGKHPDGCGCTCLRSLTSCSPRIRAKRQQTVLSHTAALSDFLYFVSSAITQEWLAPPTDLQMSLNYSFIQSTNQLGNLRPFTIKGFFCQVGTEPQSFSVIQVQRRR